MNHVCACIQFSHNIIALSSVIPVVVPHRATGVVMTSINIKFGPHELSGVDCQRLHDGDSFLYQTRSSTEHFLETPQQGTEGVMKGLGFSVAVVSRMDA